jgi:eukaryotic-like serine/threonine-protein kinase
MAKKLKPGQSVQGYKITKLLVQGGFALSYSAVAPDGRPVFLKQYKSPTPVVDWYDGYVTYQDQLQHRLEESGADAFCVKMLAAFEAVWGGSTYFQVFELIERGKSLEAWLAEDSAGTGGTTLPEEMWRRHFVWAKVFAAGVRALHAAGIVHCDLKPDNVFLIEDPSIGAGYRLKLIDMDFSLLAGQSPPWSAYVGTQGYLSPEHLAGTMPTTASDVFTSGLILYQMLAGAHPYWTGDQTEYAERVRADRAPLPSLDGPVPEGVDEDLVLDTLRRCLSLDPLERPTMEEVHAALTGRSDSGRTRTRIATSKPRGLRTEAIQLVGEDGTALHIGVRTELGKSLLKRLGPDSQYWDDRQCVVEKADTGHWQVVPGSATTNETLINGDALTGPRLIDEGDILAAGRSAKGIAKLPLTVQAV